MLKQLYAALIAIALLGILFVLALVIGPLIATISLFMLLPAYLGWRRWRAYERDLLARIAQIKAEKEAATIKTVDSTARVIEETNDNTK